MARGSFFSTLDNSQRQGLCKSAEVSGNLLWGDTPYIVTDVGAGIGAGVTKTSEVFYVGYTSSPIEQVSISASYTTPSS